MKRSAVIYPEDDNSVAIIVSSGRVKRNILIDRCLAELLAVGSWFVVRVDSTDREYVMRTEQRGGTRKNVYMHRLVAQPPNGFVVDHINGDGLDNRASNLRVCKNSINLHNRHRLNKQKSSKYLGVYYERSMKRWRAVLVLNKKCIRIGRFRTEYEAHLAYQNKKRELLGSLFIR